jgi:hypothetical protein
VPRLRRDIDTVDTSATDATWELRWLRTLLMANCGGVAGALHERIADAHDEIARRRLPPDVAVAEMWAWLDEHGLREAGERQIRHLAKARARWQRPRDHHRHHVRKET